jgi:hypothetical protein
MIHTPPPLTTSLTRRHLLQDMLRGVADPEIDAWYAQQATARDRTHRQALLHQIQQ